MKKSYCVFICLLGLVVSDNSTIGDHSITEDVSEINNSGNNLAADAVDQNTGWGEWSPWSKWSACSRTCGGGISRQQRRCRRKPCKGKIWTTKYKICNPQPCEKPSDFRAAQCAAFNNVPYSGQLLKWYPHYDPARPCALICRGVQTLENGGIRRLRQEVSDEKTMSHDITDSLQFDGDETIVVQLADKVEDGTKCYDDGADVCIGGECMKVGCDLRVGSNKNTDACGVCGGNGSSCQSRYSWSLESISVCSLPCGGGLKIAVAVCKSVGPDESVVEDSYCDASSRPAKTLMPCNTHTCTTKWMVGEWGACTVRCGGGLRMRSVFCTKENGNETTKLPDHKCSGTHKPHSQEPCNTMLCPMWETNKWSECSVTCGTGVRTRTIECRDSVGAISGDCDPAERPHTEQECKTNVACPTYGAGIALPLVQPYPLSQVSEKLTDQPVPSESTFIAEKWSPCSVTCGEGVRHREVHCKIFLEFSRTIAMLPDKQCSGPKPVETEKCAMQPCSMLENSLPYGIDTVGDSSYAESSLTDSYRSAPDSSGGSGYDSSIKVAPGSDVQTTYSWKEAGYTPCSATCLGGVQDLIINCVRDDTGKTAMPLLCAAETKPEARIRVCNDHPCPPRWNYSEFSTCMSPCGIGIQTRDVTCIHEVTRGNGKTVPVPNYMCPQPPPADRRYCNVWDCPVKWSTGEWGKCSKTCGGGVKKRMVVCEQIMAQGRKQSREERECPPQKPASEKPCNTRACHESDLTALPIITSQNATYNQTDINAKVDLRIGGVAKVFQGTPSIKIRCPVRKFDKTRIVWAKDNKEIRKSRKYKISRKGALKIIDITSPDSGVYACIAGNSRAETRLFVKFRSKEQISSEEYLRLGNSVHLERNANINSAPANSGESLYTDHAAVYGNRFDGEDISHEHSFPNNPTRKPHQKKQKISPTPSDATMMHKDHTVTSLNQPGYHESAESAAPSSASTVVPHLSYLISSLKAYWPFRSESTASDNRRATRPELAKDGSNAPVATMKYRFPSRKTGLMYQNIEDPFDDLYRNTVIPDKTFGPDEERIFIDVDPYDLDVSMLELQHSDNAKSSTLVGVTENAGGELTAKPDIDYIEESLKNVKRYWQEQRDESRGQWSTTSKDHVRSRVIISEPVTSPGNAGMDVYYVEDSRKETPKEESGFVDDGDKSINHDAYGNSRAEDSSTAISTPVSGLGLENQPRAPESDRRSPANKTAHDYSDAFDEESDKQKIERNTENRTTSDYTIARFPTTRALENGARKDATLIDDQRPTVVEEDPGEDAEDLSRDLGVHAGSAEKASDDLKEASKEGQHPANRDKLLANVLTAGVTGRDDGTTKDPYVELLAVLAVNNTENLVIEWATTEWSECSQTCGGSGFQMRGAQCTIRSADNGTSTRVLQRTVIDARQCENAGHSVPQKVRSCGMGRCPQWHATEWTPCETSRCFNWKTAMQKRDISCRLVYNTDDDRENVTLLDPNKCDESTRPPQRQECYNDACKGVWRVGEWSECNANCEEDGIKYRILQCVWFGTKKPAGNACRDIPRPAVMKTCRGPPCPQSAEDCKDHSQLCSRVKALNICKIPLYQKQCCASCR